MVKSCFHEIGHSDFDELCAFFANNNVPEVTNTFTAFCLNNDTAYFIANKPHKDKFYVFSVDDQVVGFSMLRGWDEGFEVPSFGIIIDRNYIHKGFGKTVLQLTVEEARKYGCSKVRLSVYSTNVAARKMYQDYGFIEIESLKPQKNNDVNKIIMIKELI